MDEQAQQAEQALKETSRIRIIAQDKRGQIFEDELNLAHAVMDGFDAKAQAREY